MNNKGLTLAELLAVIIIISLILLFVYPAVDDLLNDNNAKLYDEYENMMVEYAKASGIKATVSNQNIYLKLSEIDGLEQIKRNCTGYIHIAYQINKPNYYKAYVWCQDDYKTSGYNAIYQ